MTSLIRGPITGPKAFALFSSFFIVIIAVNLVLAFQAVRTFPGVEVRSSYVTSQSFDADRAAQEALGWTTAARIEGDELVLTITDAQGPVLGVDLAAMLGRATTRIADQTLAFAWDGAAWRAPATVSTGQWHLAINARAADGTPFRRRLDLMVE